jgi:hypothetical protein
MHKASTSGDRKFILHELPVLMTQLEIDLPQTWNTVVVHLYTFHTILIMLLAGPFCVNNMFKVLYTHLTTTSMCILYSVYAIPSPAVYKDQYAHTIHRIWHTLCRMCIRCVLRLSSSTQW